MMRALIAILVCAAAATVPSRSADRAVNGDSDTGAALVREFLDAAAASRVDCSEVPGFLDAYGTTWEAVCATTAVPLKTLKKSLRKLIRGRDGVVRLPGELWTSRQGYEVARFFVDRELFVLRYDPRDGGLALLPHQACFSPGALRNAGVSTTRDPGVTAPELLEARQPDYPEAARVERRSGFTMVQMVVDADGKVADACLVYAIPEGLGFREAALRAVAGYRYRPGTRDGRPVPVLVNESVTWEIR